jgi:alcohol dehydrogenase, propanol-preferring
MRSMRLVSEGRPLELSSYEIPKIEGKAALVKVDFAGVCHTDLHFIEGFYNLGNSKRLPTGLKLPITLGHEISGIVEELSFSESPPKFRKGDQVIVYPWIGCGYCRKCLDGSENLCEGKSKFLGVFMDGGYSDYVVVPDSRYLLNVEGIDPKEAASLACSGLTALSSVRKSGLGSEELLLIIGAGGLGTIATQIAKKIVGAQVAVLDVDETKLELASSLGADYVFNSSNIEEKELAKKLRAVSEEGRGVDAVIDFVGISSTTSIGFRALSKGGRLVLVGLAGGSAEFPLALFPLRGVQVVGNFTGTLDELNELVELTRRGLINPVVSGVYPLEEANAALGKLKQGEVKGRVMLKP